ncbi:MAG: hypothetical protein KME21_04275 [Desmonostoc vinosum HA7617-LM4]|jgi:hypothetical protein|nr:hypothetical protein [Desmonostoc vinosum HA7617-LM4]
MLIIWLALLEFTTIAFKPVFSTLFKSSSGEYNITKMAIPTLDDSLPLRYHRQFVIAQKEAPTLNEALERGASFWLS